MNPHPVIPRLGLRLAALYPALLVAALFALFSSPRAFAALGTAFYTLDPVAYYNQHSGSTNPQVTLVNGKLQLTLPPTTGASSLINAIARPGLVGGQQYTAVLTFRTIIPTAYPKSFHMFARPSVGGTTVYDIWQTWLGEAGESARTITMPLDLSAYTAGQWTLYLGMTGPSSILIESFVIYNGTTKENIPAVVNGTSASNLPSGVTAATGSAAITLTPPDAAAASNIVNLTTLVANNTAESANNSTRLQAAINAIATTAKTTLRIPTGTYYFSGARSINFIDRNDLIVDGQGSTFVWRQINNDGQAFNLDRCDRIVFKNLTFDWDWTVAPIASLGVVSNLSADKKQCDLTFPHLNATQTQATLSAPWLKMFEMDAANLYRTGAAILDLAGVTLAPGSAGNVIRVTFPNAMPIANGQSYCVRHYYYNMGGFKIFSSTHVLFDNFFIRSFPGMGWQFNAATHHVRLVNSGIARAAGATTPITTAADGIHFTESQGYIAIENFTFQGLGDDAINIHDNCYQGVAVTDPNDAAKLTLRKCKSYQVRIEPGDTIQLSDPDYSPLGASATQVTRVAASATQVGEDLVVIFQSALPSPLSPNIIVRNTRFGSNNVRIADCDFIETHGHGILFSGENATIENNLFRRNFVTPIQLEANIVQPLWAEGRGATNVLIRGNTFASSNQLLESDAAAIWGGHSLPWGTIDTYLYKTITIENNVFSGIPGPIVSLNNASNVIVRDNDVVYDGPVARATRHFGAILVTKSEKLGLGGNDWQNNTASPHPYGVVYDSASVSTAASNFNAATNAVSSTTTLATENFESYAAGSTFTTGQALGAAGSGWAFGWRTAGSFTTPTGSILATNPLVGGQRLNGQIVSLSGKTAAGGAITRAYAAGSLTTQSYTIRFTYRPDSTPANIRYVLSDTQTLTFGPDSTVAWQVASVNGTWQAYNGGTVNAYVDTGVPVAAGAAYDFVVNVDPVAKKWSVTVTNGANTATRTALNPRYTTYATDGATAPGGRWINFNVQEIVPSGSTTVGATGTFSVDGIVVEKP